MTTRITHDLGWHYPDWSDFEIRLTVPGKPRVSKNSRVHFERGGKPVSAPNAKAQGWTAAAVMKWRIEWNQVSTEYIPSGIAINAAIVSYLGEGQRSDADNLYSIVGDALQRPRGRKLGAGVIASDYWIVSHDGSRRRRDHADPRVEVVLSPGLE